MVKLFQLDTDLSSGAVACGRSATSLVSPVSRLVSRRHVLEPCWHIAALATIDDLGRISVLVDTDHAADESQADAHEHGVGKRVLCVENAD